MSADLTVRPGDAFGVLRRFARRRGSEERCESCGRDVPADHPHLIEPVTRRLSCVCEACAVIGPSRQRQLKRVPRDVRLLPDFQLTDAQWDSLLIPIEMAFFYDSGPAGRVVAIYPSPAGPTESLLPLETWQDVVRLNPVLARLEQDVEALVANRLGPARRVTGDREFGAEYFVLPIDQCFRLVGLIRLHWKGLSGGTEVWQEIAGFFDEMRSRAMPTSAVARA
jgi:hypothetical protein